MSNLDSLVVNIFMTNLVIKICIQLSTESIYAWHMQKIQVFCMHDIQGEDMIHKIVT